MDDYSRLSGTAPISSMPDSVLGVQKKRKISDRHRQDRKRDQGSHGKTKREDDLEILPGRANGSEDETVNNDAEEQIGYGASKLIKRFSNKIDLII